MSNEKEPLISVVMSCYNSARTLNRAINSILNQTFTTFEFIIVDDGSTDKTKELLQQYSSSDQRIILLRNNTNMGLSYSLNKGIKKATADFIARMDADDFSMPNRLKIQYDFMSNNLDIDILGCGMKRVLPNGKLLDKVYLTKKHRGIIKNIFSKPPVYHPTILIKKSVFDNFGYYDETLRWAEDADLWYRIYDKVTFHNLQSALIEYTTKERINKKILTYNLKVKWTNMKRRNLLGQNLHLLIRDFLSLVLRSIKNY